MQRAQGFGVGTLMAITLFAALAPAAAARAAAGQESHVNIGIVGTDEPSSRVHGRGVRVVELSGPRSMRGDLRRGDVVLRLDGRRIHDTQELHEALDELGNGAFTIDVLRRGDVHEIRIPRDRGGDWADRRIVVRDVRREVDRDVRRDVIRDVRRLRHRTLSPRARAEIRDVIREALQDVRQNVRDIHRIGRRDVMVLRDGRARLRDDRARLRDSMQRLRERLRELELDLDGRDWY